MELVATWIMASVNACSYFQFVSDTNHTMMFHPMLVNMRVLVRGVRVFYAATIAIVSARNELSVHPLQPGSVKLGVHTRDCTCLRPD